MGDKRQPSAHDDTAADEDVRAYPLRGIFTESAYWLAYFICPIPIAMFMKRYTYKGGIVFGLLTAAAGALLFFLRQ